MLAIASETSSMTSSISLAWPALSNNAIPKALRVSLASPVPFLASATLLLNLCKAISAVSDLIPTCSAANLNFCKNSVPTPSFSEVLTSLSILAVETPTAMPTAVKDAAVVLAARPKPLCMSFVFLSIVSRPLLTSLKVLSN